MKMWHKLARANIAAVVGALLMFGSVLARSTVQTIATELDRRAQAEAQLVARQVDDIIRSAEYCGNTLVVMTNDTVASVGSADSISISTRILIENQMAFALSVFPSVANAWIALPSREVVGYGRTPAPPEAVLRAATDLLQADEPMGPSRLNQRPSSQIGDSVLIVAKQMINIDTGEPLASLVLVVDSLSFARVLAQTDTDFAARFRIVDDQERTVVEPADPSSRSGEELRGFREFDAPVAQIGWRVVSRISRQAIRSHVRRTVLIYVAMLGVASIAASVVALSVSRTVTRPLESLERQMREIDIQRGTGTVSVPGIREIEHVADGANRLLERVHALVDRIAAEERERQRYRLELLQAQIKPHFLYNALEMIHILGETGRNSRAQRAIRTLSEFYRLSLADGNELISLQTELDLTGHYLFIQHLRYHDQFQYSVRCTGAGAESLLLPKLTLQPLVENAIYHGIKGMQRKCTISVKAERAASGGWRLLVSDDGRGMPTARLAELRELRSKGSFGFRSVIQRLRLHLADVRFEVRSLPDDGTAITIEIKDRSVEAEPASAAPHTGP